MKLVLTAAALALISAPSFASDVTRHGSQAAIIAPSDYFTGTAFVEPKFGRNDVRDFELASVTFLPGARSNWHTHPKGQSMYVVSGTGWTQVEGGERQTVNVGDVVWCPPDVKHWHGATDQTSMTHLVVNQYEGDTVVTWMERVTDQQYLGN